MPSISLKLSESLSDLVRSKYLRAQATGALIYSTTKLTTIRVNDIPYQLRWCAALAQKPTGKEWGTAPQLSNQPTQKPMKPDPFENPSPDLLVKCIPADDPTHNVVLNKYPVIPQHFILATKEYKEQTDKLEEEDLAMTYACLQGWERGRLFAFFNSGDHSGASQGHRHIQFLPIEEMRAGQSETQWTPLIDAMRQDGIQALDGTSTIVSVPFAHFSLPIPADATPSILLRSYETLLEIASAVLQSSHSGRVLPMSAAETMPTATCISYNLAMTTSVMVICPRRSEASMLVIEDDEPSPKGRGNIGPVALNGTMLAGTLMVKTEREWDALQGGNGGSLLTKVLEDAGVPHSRNKKGL